MITQERLKRWLKYNQITGVFTWIEQRQHIKAGSVAGSVKKSGYIEIKLDGVSYQAHRLAWLYVYGEMPSSCIDHIDMDKTNNRFRNLRQATAAENLRNRKARKDSATGQKGVYAAANRFKAQITVDGKRIHLGCYATKEEAAEAYAKGAAEHHGQFARSA
jgi:hypothetical protein